MPRKYKRKEGALPHGEWSQEALIEAMKAMDEGKLSINGIARRYGIPARTLQRRYKNKNTLKITAGKHPALDFDNENRLAAEIQKLENEGFTPTRDLIRRIAFEFAENLGLNVPFNKETRMAGVCWLTSFLERHPELKVHKLSSHPSMQETEKKRKVEVASNVVRRAESLKNLPSQNEELVTEHSHYSDNDPLIVKVERFDDESNDASIDDPKEKLHYLDKENQALVEISGSSWNQDVVKQNESLKDESRSEIVDVKCDGVDLLFLGYAAAVKKLSRRKQIVVKQEILRIIAEAELSDLE